VVGVGVAERVCEGFGVGVGDESVRSVAVGVGAGLATTCRRLSTYSVVATTALTTIASMQMINASLGVRADRLMALDAGLWLAEPKAESSTGEGCRGSPVVTSNHRAPSQ
jgi:hypothetical protein